MLITITCNNINGTHSYQIDVNIKIDQHIDNSLFSIENTINTM